VTPGDLLLLYSDGVIEAQNGERELFGTARLRETIRGLCGHSAREVQDALLAQVERHVGPAPQFDDITLLVARRDEQGPVDAPPVDLFAYDGPA
jgi:sigma-B regulation protein RsbU (phosphoserine phosphatase)